MENLKPASLTAAAVAAAPVLVRRPEPSRTFEWRNSPRAYRVNPDGTLSTGAARFVAYDRDCLWNVVRLLALFAPRCFACVSLATASAC